MNYYRYKSSFSAQHNQELQRHYLDSKDQEDTHKTHFFEGRYENIYIDKGRTPNLSVVLSEALVFASKTLNSQTSLQTSSEAPLKVGFWFNEMHFGDQTISHTHDEDDELLSGVYYINVPKKSGDLVLGNKELDVVYLTPKAGEFIFFAPDLMHGVMKSQSEEIRLSIGMNFGPV